MRYKGIGYCVACAIHVGHGLGVVSCRMGRLKVVEIVLGKVMCVKWIVKIECQRVLGAVGAVEYEEAKCEVCDVKRLTTKGNYLSNMS